MSEIDENGAVLHTFTDASLPGYLSLNSEGQILIAESGNDRIVLLNSQLCLERVLIDKNSQATFWRPERLYFNEITSERRELHVLYSSGDDLSAYNVISRFILQ